MPRVSVILPVRGGAATLDAAIESMRAQSEPAWELLVVDDGSSDASAAIAARLAAMDARIRLYHNPGRGLVSALNHGIAQARAPLLARMDADDVSHPRRLARQCDLLDKHPEIGLVSCLVTFGWAQPSPPGSATAHPAARAGAGYKAHVDWINVLCTPREIALGRFVEAPVAHPSVVFRRSVVTAHGAYRTGDFPEDYELWLRWMDAGVVFAKVRQPLLLWRDSPTRLSRTDPRYEVRAFYRLKCAYLARWLSRELASERQLWLWGAGRPTRRRLDLLDREGHRFAGFIDVDPAKIGGRIDGRPVLGPDQLPPVEQAFIVIGVASRGARAKIRALLQSRGYREGRDFIAAA